MRYFVCVEDKTYIQTEDNHEIGHFIKVKCKEHNTDWLHFGFTSDIAGYTKAEF